jgi:hypothetical protein
MKFVKRDFTKSALKKRHSKLVQQWRRCLAIGFHKLGEIALDRHLISKSPASINKVCRPKQEIEGVKAVGQSLFIKRPALVSTTASTIRERQSRLG